jgi:predicted aldo/keto reductase-like oxidoreductase
MSPFKPLTDAERGVIAKALAAYRQAATVPCTGCRYCLDCPSGVDIPKVLAVYNNYERIAAEKHPMANFLFEMEYHLFTKEERAENCVSCGQCRERCPQHIDIPGWMEKITRLHGQLQNTR